MVIAISQGLIFFAKNRPWAGKVKGFISENTVNPLNHIETFTLYSRELKIKKGCNIFG